MNWEFLTINNLMTCNTQYGCSQKKGCVDTLGCSGECPDFVIRRYDNKPPFKVKVEDCDGPLDLTDLVLEATMWAKGKLKASLTSDVDNFALADNIGFPQVMVGDIIVIERTRLPEKMLVIAFDEENSLIQVERGYDGTTAQDWKKGTSLKIMKFIGAAANTEMILQDVIQMDGSVLEDQLIESYFVYEWGPNDTCLPGCYYLEFKLMKMGVPFTDPDLTASDFGCGLPSGVEWVRRFPMNEGFLIQINESSISEI